MNKFNNLLLLTILVTAPLCAGITMAQNVNATQGAPDPIQLAQTAISKRDWQGAELILHPLTISQPRNPFVFYEMAQVYENTNRIEAARQIYRGLASIPDAAQRQYAIVVRTPKSSYMTSLASLSQAKLNMLNVNHPASAAPAVATASPLSPLAPTANSSLVAVQAKSAPLPSPASTFSSSAASELVINQTLQSWATAWVNKDLSAYFSHYVPNYKGDLRLATAWQQQRRRNISNKQLIELDISEIQIKLINALKAQVRFKQVYKADEFQSTEPKMLNMVKRGNSWLIEHESIQ